MPLLLAVILAPIATAQHEGEALVTHGEQKEAAYLVPRTITEEIELISMESLHQFAKIGSEIMKV